MRGDRVEVVVDAGDTTRSYEITASKAGRRVEVSIGRGGEDNKSGDKDAAGGPYDSTGNHARCSQECRAARRGKDSVARFGPTDI